MSILYYRTVCFLSLLALHQMRAQAPAPDTAHSIRISLPLAESHVYRGVLEGLLANNMTVTGQSANAIFASPVEAPGASIRIMIVGSPTSTEVMISEALAKAGGGSSFQGTGMSFGGNVEAVDRGGNKFWKRVEQLAATLRALKD
jgi:hypothetical protein